MTTPTPPAGAYLLINYDNNTQQLNWYPTFSDPTGTRESIETVRAWIADQGFNDATPQLQLAWFSPVLEGLSVPISMLSVFANNWPDTYAALGLDPPTD